MTVRGDQHWGLVEATRPLIQLGLRDWHARGRRVDRAVVFVMVSDDVVTVMTGTQLDALDALDWNDEFLRILPVEPGQLLVITIIDRALRVHRATLHQPQQGHSPRIC